MAFRSAVVKTYHEHRRRTKFAGHGRLTAHIVCELEQPHFPFTNLRIIIKCLIRVHMFICRRRKNESLYSTERLSMVCIALLTCHRKTAKRCWYWWSIRSLAISLSPSSAWPEDVDTHSCVRTMVIQIFLHCTKLPNISGHTFWTNFVRARRTWRESGTSVSLVPASISFLWLVL